MNKIFCTGGTGTIGKHFGKRVVNLSLDLQVNIQNYFNENINSGQLFIHAAGIVGDKAVKSNLELSRKVNVESTSRLARACLRNNYSKFIFLSTSHVYAKSLDSINENYNITSRGIYSMQKIEAENNLLEIFKEYPEKLCIVRIFSLLDWGMANFTLGGGVEKLITTNSEFVIKNGDDIRDFLTPKSVANTIIEIALCDSLYGIVNLSSGVGISVKHAISRMLREGQLKIPKKRIYPGTSDFPKIIGDNSKLKSKLPNLDLSWKPSVYKLT